MNKSIPRLGLYLDHSHKKKNGTCNVKIRMYYRGKTKYYKTSIDVNPSIYAEVSNKVKVKPKFRPLKAELDDILFATRTIVNEIDDFSFSEFEKLYYNHNGGTNDVTSHFLRKIDELKQNEQISTMESYQQSLRKLTEYFGKKAFTFDRIDSKELQSIEKWYLSNGYSPTTVGIHFENLRHIFNRAVDDGLLSEKLNPFSKNKGYRIRKQINVKKGVPIKTIQEIVRLDISDNPKKEKARDFWLICFYLSGMNLKDLLLLKKDQVSGNSISFIREKTKNRQSRVRPVTLFVPEQALKLMKKYEATSGELFFTILKDIHDVVATRKQVKNFNRFINQHMKSIGHLVSYDGSLSVNAARHSFATIAVNGGANLHFIKEAMGHTSVTTTENYIKGLELDYKAQTTKEIFKDLL